jgi:PilZ domain
LTERRREVRVPLDSPISVRVLDQSARVLTGRIVNLSGKGLRLKLSGSVEPGILVQARIGNRIIMAQARYCIPDGQEFHAGIEIKDAFPIPGGGAEEVPGIE